MAAASEEIVLEFDPTKETKTQLSKRQYQETKNFKNESKLMLSRSSKADKKATKNRIKEMEAEMTERHARESELLEKYLAGELTTGDGDGDDGEAGGADSGGGGDDVSTTTDGDDDGEDDKPVFRKSKAQRRRERKAKEAAERRAAIEAEVANEPNKRELERAALDEKLTPLSLRIEDVRADGHCLYRALGLQLSDDAEAEVQRLRELTAARLRETADDVMPFLIEVETPEDYEEYCSKVESTTEWGGHVELQALSHVLQKRIVIYAADAPEVVVGGEHGEDDASTLRLSYHQYELGLGEHYNAVVPA